MSCKRFGFASIWVVLLLVTAGCGRSWTELDTDHSPSKRDLARELPSGSNGTSPASRQEDRRDRAVGSAVGSSGFSFNFRLYARPDADPWAPVIYTKALRGDFNGDGRADLVFGLEANEIEITYQDGNGTFSAPRIIDRGIENYSSSGHLVIGDFNEDGIDDIVFDTVTENGVGGGVAMLRSHRDAVPELRHLHAPAFYTSGSEAQGWAAADIDGDGQLDLVALHNWPAAIGDLGLLDAADPACPEDKPCHYYLVYYGDGSGGLRSPRPIRIQGLPAHQVTNDFLVQDIDNDGLQEIVFSYADGRGSHDAAYVTQLPIAGSSSRPVLLHEKFSGEPLFFGDINGDGLTDSIHGNAIFLRESRYVFSEPYGLAIYYYKDSPWHVIADFDGNGQVDLVNHQFRTFNETPYFATYLQKNGTLQPPFFLYDPPTTHFVKTSDERHAAATGDFNSDGCLDIALAIGYSGVLLLEGQNCVVTLRRTGGNLKPRTR